MKTISRRFLGCLLLFVSLCATAAPRLPNVVVIFCDDLGYADIGPFGCKAYATPNLDRMAREGRKFTHFHVAQAVCSASRAALLTGCYPNRIGIHGALGPGARHGIHADETTLPEVFKQRGYATGMAGKWHLGHHAKFLPTRHGFDEYYGLPYSNDMWPHHPEAKKGSYPALPLLEGEKVIDDDVTPADQPALTAAYTERAVKFIERNKGRPFFFYLAHSMPHVPLFVSDRFKGKSGAGLFGDVIQEIDWSVGQVLDALKQHKLDDNTLVIFTSDNGPWLSYGNHAGSAGPLREGKGTAWEGGTRVPCLMRWPGVLAAQSSSDAMWMSVDVLPTLATLIGAPLPPRKIDGRNVWGLITDAPGAAGAPHPHDAYLSYYAQNELQAVWSGDGQWKLQLPHTYRTLGGKNGGRNGTPAAYIQKKITQPELYNLKGDAGETQDVAKAHPELVAQLLAHAAKARADLGDSLTQQEGSGRREPGRLANP